MGYDCPYFPLDIQFYWLGFGPDTPKKHFPKNKHLSFRYDRLDVGQANSFKT